jgi:hypothetical protein
MAALSLSISAIRPLNRWDYSSICPGPQGSVGDALPQERYKSSMPGDFRWNPNMHGRNESKYGSNVRDGFMRSYTSGGGPSRTLDSNWQSGRSFRTNHGWYMQDLRAPDKRIEPVMGSLPQYDWRNKIATVNRAMTTGDMFPIPRGGVLQAPTGPPRGGMFPRTTDIISGDTSAAPNADNQLNAGPLDNPVTSSNFIASGSSFNKKGLTPVNGPPRRPAGR